MGFLERFRSHDQRQEQICPAATWGARRRVDVHGRGWVLREAYHAPAAHPRPPGS